MERQRKIRQQEIEEKLIEEETARRVEELVAKRVEEELEKRKDEIEREVLRRVEEAKRIMERQLLEELERQRQAELAAQKAREVTLGRLERRPLPPFSPTSPSPVPPSPIALPAAGHSGFQQSVRKCHHEVLFLPSLTVVRESFRAAITIAFCVQRLGTNLKRNISVLIP